MERNKRKKSNSIKCRFFTSVIRCVSTIYMMDWLKNQKLKRISESEQNQEFQIVMRLIFSHSACLFTGNACFSWISKFLVRNWHSHRQGWLEQPDFETTSQLWNDQEDHHDIEVSIGRRDDRRGGRRGREGGGRKMRRWGSSQPSVGRAQEHQARWLAGLEYKCLLIHWRLPFPALISLVRNFLHCSFFFLSNHSWRVAWLSSVTGYWISPRSHARMKHYGCHLKEKGETGWQDRKKVLAVDTEPSSLSSISVCSFCFFTLFNLLDCLSQPHSFMSEGYLSW